MSILDLDLIIRESQYPKDGFYIYKNRYITTVYLPFYPLSPVSLFGLLFRSTGINGMTD
jgi:hypothetical protein